MKFRHFLFAALAGVLAFSACKESDDPGVANVSVNPTSLSFEAEGTTLSIELTATRDWTVSKPDWVVLSATSGSASTKVQTLTVSVEDNKGNDRSGEVVFNIGLMKAALTVSQKGLAGELTPGSGTLEDPFSVAGVIAYVQDLGSDVASTDKVYVKGKISQITEQYGTLYGNGTFYITDNGEATDDRFYAYRILYLGNKKFTDADTQIAEGDEVIIYGNVVNYRGNTPETVQNAAFLYSLNGKTEGGNETPVVGTPSGDGTESNPFNVAAAIAKAQETGTTATSESYYIQGKVKSITEAFGAQYGNATFDMVDEGNDAAFKAYRVLYFDNQKWKEGDLSLNEGDDVIVYAKIVNFYGNTPETSGGYVYSINGQKGQGQQQEDPKPGTISGDGSLDNPFNVAAAIDAVKNLGWTSNSEYDKVGPYYVKGTVKNVKEAFTAQYGNGTFQLIDPGYEDAVFTAYRILYFNNQKWVEGNGSVAEGDEIVVYAELMNYCNNTPETVQNSGYLYSVNGQTEDDPDAIVYKDRSKDWKFTHEVVANADGSYTTHVAISGVDTPLLYMDGTTLAAWNDPDNGMPGGDLTGKKIAEFILGMMDEFAAYGMGRDYFITESGSYESEFWLGEGQHFEYVLGFDENYEFTGDYAIYYYNVSTSSQGGGEGGSITLDKAALAALLDKNAVNQLDDVVSLQNASTYTGTVSELRIYKGQAMTISAADGYVITQIDMTCGSNNPSSGFATVDGLTLNGNDAVWAGASQSVSLTAANKQVRVTEMTITYEAR